MASYNINVNLSAEEKTSVFLSQGYAYIPPSAVSAPDFSLRLGFALAYAAAAYSDTKRGTEEVIANAKQVAQLALDEVFGLRPMALFRPDNSQMAALIEQIAAARSANGLSAL